MAGATGRRTASLTEVLAPAVRPLAPALPVPAVLVILVIDVVPVPPPLLVILPPVDVLVPHDMTANWPLAMSHVDELVAKVVVLPTGVPQTLSE